MLEKIIDAIVYRFSQFGKAPLCNLNPDHGFQINGFYFPFCVRCTAIIFSTLLAIFIIFKLRSKFTFSKVVNWLLFLCFIPCLVDGLLQYGFGIESNNLRRALTGIPVGFALVNTIFWFADWLFYKLYKKRL